MDALAKKIQARMTHANIPNSKILQGNSDKEIPLTDLTPDQQEAVVRVQESKERIHNALLPRVKKEFYALQAELESTKMHPSRAMRKIIDFIDSYIERSEVPKMSVCKKGCSHCCHGPVEITKAEAKYIESRTEHKARSSVPMSCAQKHTTCPFLKNNECSIYKYRPIACRSFYTIDSPDYCAQGGHVEHVYINQYAMGPVMAATQLIMLNLGMEYSDIRGYFAHELV